MGFHARLEKAWSSSGSMLCVGLDPDPARFPAPLDGAPDAITRFCTAIVDATADLVCAFKPQIAHFAAQRAEPQLEAVCSYIRERHPDVVLVLDAKRGDIGSTAEQYAREAFGRYGADAVTVNPYLGTDAATPFLEHGGVLALCRTSNPGSGELQDLDVGGRPLYEHVAAMVAERWSAIGDCGLVVGATYPEQLAAVRSDRRRPADPASGRRRPGRRRRGLGRRRLDGTRHRADRQLLAGDPLRLVRRRLRRGSPRRRPAHPRRLRGHPADAPSECFLPTSACCGASPQQALGCSGLQGDDADDAGGGAQGVERRRVDR